jgi:hypothetical protein
MSPTVNAALSLLALGLAIAAIVLATIANRRWAQRPRPASPGAGLGGESAPAPADSPPTQAESATLLSEVATLGSASASLRSEVEALRREVESLAASGDQTGDPTALRHVALVRYDAFADVGGRLSYSVALLDDTGSGLVLTTLAGKADVRTYVRTISAGTPDGSLTAEEQQAIEAAVGSRQ